MNFPIVPGHNPKGKKAARVVAVEAIMGHAISPIPSIEACFRDMP